jgi:hypothetical protein
MATRFEHDMDFESESLADLKGQAADLERKLSDVRGSLERQLARPADHPRQSHGRAGQTHHRFFDDERPGDDRDDISDVFASPRPARGHGYAASGGQGRTPEARTRTLVDHGRSNSYSPGLSRSHKIAVGVAVLAVLSIVLGVILSGDGPSWPPSVATVRTEAAKACQNPDVKSEPGQVNFACASATNQILWVFALMTSDDNPNFADSKTGRLGLEPITPAQGGEVAWSLNLHSPYNPHNPIDSLGVAARAINNIVGGATVTGSNGNPVVQSGLESDSANCLRYTGSARVTSRAGFPAVCAKPITTLAGQGALVADIYQKWVVGAAPQAAQDAAVLFENATNPGNPQVQAILKHLPDPKLMA